MKVLFKQDVPGTARAGQVKEVADGFARNYLIPRGIAVAATPAALKQVAAVEAAARRRAAEEEQGARALKERLEAQPIVVEAKAGAQGRLYGSVTTADIATAVQRQLGTTIDRRSLELADPIRHVGTFQVTARLHHAVTATIAVDVRPEAGASA